MMVGHDISSYAQTLPRPLSLPRSLLSSSSTSSPSQLLSRLASLTSSCPSSPSDSSSLSRLSSFPGLLRSHPDPMSSSSTSEPSSPTSSITAPTLPPSSTPTASAAVPTTGPVRSSSSSNGGGTGSGAPSSHRLSLPRPQPTTMSSGRLPVRMGLSDPRVRSYISKPLTSPHPRQEQPLPTSSSSFGGAHSQSRPPASSSSLAAAGRAYGSSETSSHYGAPMVDSRDPQTSHPVYSSSSSSSGSSRSHDLGQSQHGHSRHSSLDARDYRTQRDHGDYWSLSSHASQRDPEERRRPNPSASTYVSAQANESMHRTEHGHAHRKYSDSQIYGKTTGHSSSPSPLPSPSPSLTSMSPDWPSVARPQHDPYQQQHPQQQPHHQRQYNTLSQPLQQNGHSQQQQRARPDLSSPVNSEVDAGSMDLRILPPLFTSSPPPAFSSSHRGPRLLPPPSGMMMEQPDALYAAALFSGARGTGGLAPTDPRTVSPPLTSLNWSSKHHHHRVPVRSPVRGTNQDIMATSLTESESSGYMKMDFYDIYLRNPKLLRPEGGKLDERRALEDAAFARGALAQSGHGVYTTASTEGSSKSKSTKGKSTLTTKRSRSPTAGLSRRQSIPLMATATGRVLRHEDARQDDAVVHRLGVQPPQQRRGSKSISNSMSIRNLLSDDITPVIKREEHHEHRNNSDTFRSGNSISSHDSEGSDYSRMMAMGSSGTLVKKRKKAATITGENGDEPKKRKRISKKQLAEAGLLGEDGEVKKRKRTKKITDPDHVSPAGFRHGGERVVQEPEELVILEPDVGPISMLDVKSPPRVIWKGTPLSVVGKPGYDQLHPHEEYIASTLRLSPAQYLACKRTLIMASREYLATPDGKQFRKSDAQKLCRIDVNKTSRLWEAFAKIGWLAGITEQDI